MKWMNSNFNDIPLHKTLCSIGVGALFIRFQNIEQVEMNIEKVFRCNLKRNHCDSPFQSLSKTTQVFTQTKGMVLLSDAFIVASKLSFFTLAVVQKHTYAFTQTSARTRNHLSLFLWSCQYSAFISQSFNSTPFYLGKHFTFRTESKVKSFKSKTMKKQIERKETRRQKRNR